MLDRVGQDAAVGVVPDDGHAPFSLVVGVESRCGFYAGAAARGASAETPDASPGRAARTAIFLYTLLPSRHQTVVRFLL
jgi:hypothetical protein